MNATKLIYKKIKQRDAINELLKLETYGPEAELLRDLCASGPRETVSEAAESLAALGLIQQYDDLPAYELAEACTARPTTSGGLWRSGDSIIHECLKCENVDQLFQMWMDKLSGGF